ncbi:NUDIX hydrolase domain-like protein [Irpex rosettiformis]|uniref:NUDIX hydrolase domain-like protein n=1 Tax=Irpex rosettiformis TaxID=378272 RepID=A0ACB8TRP8_9APHY|nr:NUDIX hydrolase domain-like protein [Irpex rosettiformis]
MSNTTEIPPLGVTYEGKLTHEVSGGEGPWLPFDKVKHYTNAFIRQNGKILLGYKKRGFGLGLYNGFGGKVEPGETSAQAAVRELEEEAGITAPLRRCGSLFFILQGLEAAFCIEIFVAEEYEGTIIETDEMGPEWFSDGSDPSSDLPPIPLKQMWADDEFWMPMFLNNRMFVGRGDFSEDGKMLKYWFGEQIL